MLIFVLISLVAGTEENRTLWENHLKVVNNYSLYFLYSETLFDILYYNIFIITTRLINSLKV